MVKNFHAAPQLAQQERLNGLPVKAVLSFPGRNIPNLHWMGLTQTTSYSAMKVELSQPRIPDPDKLPLRLEVYLLSNNNK